MALLIALRQLLVNLILIRSLAMSNIPFLTLLENSVSVIGVPSGASALAPTSDSMLCKVRLSRSLHVVGIEMNQLMRWNLDHLDGAYAQQACTIAQRLDELCGLGMSACLKTNITLDLQAASRESL